MRGYSLVVFGWFFAIDGNMDVGCEACGWDACFRHTIFLGVGNGDVGCEACGWGACFHPWRETGEGQKIHAEGGLVAKFLVFLHALRK